MNKVEVNGRTIEEALEAASQELQVPVDAVEYEIVDSGSKSFLGLGGTPSQIMAWIKEGYVPPQKEQEPVERTEVREVDEEAFTASILKTLEDILGAMKLNAKPEIKPSEDNEVYVNIDGEDVAMLIGKHGQTLDALQYLVGIAASNSAKSNKRFTLDAGGYREKHRKMLEQMAQEYAKAVVQQGEEAVMDPLPARDRRIVHMALADSTEVHTYSEGEGFNRHVVISPKK